MKSSLGLVWHPKKILIFTIIVIFVASWTSLIFYRPAYAAQLQSRSIQLSQSTASATGVIYKIQFNAQTSAAAMLVVFCTDSPVNGQPCTPVPGLSAPSTSIIPGAQTTGWSFQWVGGHSTQVGFTGPAYSPGLVSLEITGVNNPSVTGTIYARILTYTDNTFGGYTSPTAPGTYLDYGGVAFMTTNDITVTATVMETLTFCTSKTAPGTGCSGASAASLVLGTGSPKALSTTAPILGTSTDTAYAQVSTNATSGAVINLKAVSSTCAGLNNNTDATCEIAAKGAYGAIAANAGQFGVNVSRVAGGTGTVVLSTNYGNETTGTAENNYGMGAGATSTYGDQIASVTGPAADKNILLTYAANSTPTTAAGIYTTTESLIATGTF